MKRYDLDYFHRHYVDPRTRIESEEEFSRHVAMVVAVAEYLLRRPLGSVLDIGCGEGRWRESLDRLRPGVEYMGIDPSPEVVRRWGTERNLQLGRLGDAARWNLGSSYDLILCSDVLHYLSAKEIDRGLRQILQYLDGVLYLDVSTIEDDPEGDLEGWYARTEDWYRRRFQRLGLVECGLQFWIGPS